jgi:hypothetical protein
MGHVFAVHEDADRDSLTSPHPIATLCKTQTGSLHMNREHAL